MNASSEARELAAVRKLRAEGDLPFQFEERGALWRFSLRVERRGRSATLRVPWHSRPLGVHASGSDVPSFLADCERVRMLLALAAHRWARRRQLPGSAYAVEEDAGYVGGRRGSMGQLKAPVVVTRHARFPRRGCGGGDGSVRPKNKPLDRYLVGAHAMTPEEREALRAEIEDRPVLRFQAAPAAPKRERAGLERFLERHA